MTERPGSKDKSDISYRKDEEYIDKSPEVRAIVRE